MGDDLSDALGDALDEAADEVGHDLGGEAGGAVEHAVGPRVLEAVLAEAVEGGFGAHRVDVVVAERAAVEPSRPLRPALGAGALARRGGRLGLQQPQRVGVELGQADVGGQGGAARVYLEAARVAPERVTSARLRAHLALRPSLACIPTN